MVTLYLFSNLIGKDNPAGDKSRMVLCPKCKCDFSRIRDVKTIPGNDNYESGWWGRGDLVVITLKCEGGHEWELCLGFHKGQTFIFGRDENGIDYYEYINSPEWKKKSEEAKSRAGYRCQVCNRGQEEITLNTHHRSYKNLGNESAEDLTVLCRECHELFESNGKIKSAT